MKYLMVLLVILSSCSAYDHGPDREIPVQEYQKMLVTAPDTVLLRAFDEAVYITTLEDGFISQYTVGEDVDVALSILFLCVAFAGIVVSFWLGLK